MIYFIILFFLIICIYRFDYCDRRKYRKLCYWSLFILFIALATFRYRIGIDSIRYEHNFPNWPKLWELTTFRFDYTRYDPGFITLASIPRSFTDDFMAMQFFESLVVTSVIFWFSSKNCKHVFLCLTFFYFFQYLNFMTEIMREAFAVSLFLLAWPSFRDGVWWRYFTICLGVAFIHTSGVFTFLLPLTCLPIVRQLFYFGRRTIIISVIVVGIGYIVQRYFYDVFRAIAVTDRMMDRATVYSEGELSGQILNINGIISNFIRFILYPLLALFFYHRKIKRLDKQERKEYRKMEIMVMIGLYINIMAIPISIFSRFFNYVCMFTYAFVADWVFSSLKFKRKSYKFKPAYWFILFLPMFSMQMYSYFSPVNNSGNLKVYMSYYPYYTRFDRNTDPDREDYFRYMHVN